MISKVYLARPDTTWVATRLFGFLGRFGLRRRGRLHNTGQEALGYLDGDTISGVYIVHFDHFHRETVRYTTVRETRRDSEQYGEPVREIRTDREVWTESEIWTDSER